MTRMDSESNFTMLVDYDVFNVTDKANNAGKYVDLLRENAKTIDELRTQVRMFQDLVRARDVRIGELVEEKWRLETRIKELAETILKWI